MPPRGNGPTKNQYNKNLGYSQHTPSFLVALQNRVNGISNSDENAEYERDDRPPIPTRPGGDVPDEDSDPGEKDEEGEERPQVVVLRAGKHLSSLEVENEKRKAKGLPPLPEKGETKDQPEGTEPATDSQVKKGKRKAEEPPKGSNYFAVGAPGSSKTQTKKRRVVGDAANEVDPTPQGQVKKAKKEKKPTKGLLSFGDGAD